MKELIEPGSDTDMTLDRGILESGLVVLYYLHTQYLEKFYQRVVSEGRVGEGGGG